MPDAFSTYPTVTNKLLPPPDPMQAAGQAIGVANGIQALSQSQFDLGNKQLGALNNIIGSVASLPDPQIGDVTRGVTEAVRMGVLPKDAAAQALTEASSLPPGQIKRWLFDHMSKNMSIQQQMQSGGMAAPEMINNGQTLAPATVRSGLQPGVSRAAGASIPLLQTPGELAQIGTIITPEGRTVQATQRQRQAAVGDPARMDTTAAPQPGSAGLPAAPPGNEEGVKVLASDLNAAAGKIAGTRDLAKAIQLADQLGPNATGPSADAEARIKEFLVTRGIVKPGDTNVVPRQELAKYLARYAANSPTAARSDAAQAATYASSPNITQSLPAIAELARNAISSDRMDAALPGSFPKDKSGADYLRYKSQFMQSQDQAAYRFDLLPPDEQRKVYTQQREAYTNGTPQQKAAAEKFLRSLQTAHKTIYSAGAPDGQQ
jgi:hypothetical protein